MPNNWFVLNKINRIRSEYLKLFNFVQKLNYWYYLAILGTIQLRVNKIISVKNTRKWFKERQKILILNKIVST